MAETLERQGLWHVTLAEEDLVKQAGLDKGDFEQDFGFFKYRGRRVVISHIFNEHLVVSMEGEEDETMRTLVEGFSKVVGYTPFCKYNLLLEEEGKVISTPTYEWDKLNPNLRYQELSVKKTTSGLTRLLRQN